VVAARDLGAAPVDVGNDVGTDVGGEDASTPATPPMEDGGCGCRTLPSRGGAAGTWLLALAALGLRRRRGLRS